MRRIELPAALAFGTAAAAAPGRRAAGAGQRPGVRGLPLGRVVGRGCGRRAGRATYDNETCLGVLLEQVRGRHAVAARRLDRKDAALGAAGAAVALVGTAALMRRRRKRGSGA